MGVKLGDVVVSGEKERLTFRIRRSRFARIDTELDFEGAP